MARVTIILVTLALVLTLHHTFVLSPRVLHSVSRALFDQAAAWGLDSRYAPLFSHLVWAFGTITLMFIIPALVTTRILGWRLRDMGLRREGLIRRLPRLALIVVPVLIGAIALSGTEAFQFTYPFYRTPQGPVDLLIWELSYAVQFFAVEFLFRGFVVLGTRDRLGALSVPVMMVPYVMIHFSKPVAETFGALPAGLILGVLALRTRSIWGGVFLHIAVAWTMDIAALLARPPG